MIIEAHYNDHGDYSKTGDKKPVQGDLLVTFSFPGEEIEDLCVGTDKRWMDEKDKDSFIPGWQDRIAEQYAAHSGRALSDDQAAELADAIAKAK